MSSLPGEVVIFLPSVVPMDASANDGRIGLEREPLHTMFIAA